MTLSHEEHENLWLKRVEAEQERKGQIRKALPQGIKANAIIRDSGKKIMTVARSTKSLWNHMEERAPQRPPPIGHPLRDPTQEGLHLFVQNRRNQKPNPARVRKLEEVEKKEWEKFNEEIHRYNRLPSKVKQRQYQNSADDPARAGI